MHRMGMLVALVVVALIPSQVQAQCGYVEFCGAGHYLAASAAENACFHSGCKVCAPGSTCHPVCYQGCSPIGEEEGDEENLSENAAPLHKILAAARARDLERRLKLARSSPGYVHFNRERQSLQVSGCGGTMVANLVLRTARDREIALAIPEMTAARLLARGLTPAWDVGR